MCSPCRRGSATSSVTGDYRASNEHGSVPLSDRCDLDRRTERERARRRLHADCARKTKPAGTVGGNVNDSDATPSWHRQGISSGSDVMPKPSTTGSCSSSELSKPGIATHAPGRPIAMECSVAGALHASANACRRRRRCRRTSASRSRRLNPGRRWPSAGRRPSSDRRLGPGTARGRSASAYFTSPPRPRRRHRRRDRCPGAWSPRRSSRPVRRAEAAPRTRTTARHRVGRTGRVRGSRRAATR